MRRNAFLAFTFGLAAAAGVGSGLLAADAPVAARARRPRALPDALGHAQQLLREVPQRDGLDRRRRLRHHAAGGHSRRMPRSGKPRSASCAAA